jgi:vacuole morphology and inheritance protein 14
MVAEFAMAKNFVQIEKLISVMGRDFATSSDSNKRKGGLIGLAGIAIGLGKVRFPCSLEPCFSASNSFIFFQDTDKFIKDLVIPILNCLSDADTRVRYFASESLYNVVKVARGSIIPMFPKIFSTLSQLVTDPDQVGLFYLLNILTIFHS